MIVSYLLASSTVDAQALVEEIDALCKRLGSGPVTLLYTNSLKPDANRDFEMFQAALEQAGFSMPVNDQQPIIIDRLSGPKERRLRYALFYRQARDPFGI